MPALFALALLVHASPAHLTEAAQASTRPRECGMGARPSLWERVREPSLQAYCDLLARGFGKLAKEPEIARDDAKAALALAKDRAAPWVLRGRAELLLGEYDAALGAFERALDLDPRSLEEPGALHALAIALERSGEPDEALVAYRKLTSRLSLLDGPEQRIRALLEGAELSLSLDALDEALAFLRRAQLEPVREAKPRVWAMLALALDRSGREEEAKIAILEAESLGGARASAAFALDALSTREAEAALALLSEATNPKLSVKLWESYLDKLDAKSPRRAHAQSRLDALIRKGRGDSR